MFFYLLKFIGLEMNPLIQSFAFSVRLLVIVFCFGLINSACFYNNNNDGEKQKSMKNIFLNILVFYCNMGFC